MKHYQHGNPKPELIVAIAGPLGADIRSVADEIELELKSYHYRCEQVRVSSLIQSWCAEFLSEQIDSSTEEKRINALMNAGDILRTDSKSGAAAIPLVANEIRRRRQNFLLQEGCSDEHDAVELYNTCFLINSLKHPDEVDLLRNIYGNKMIFISIVESQKNRRKNLIEKIAKAHRSTKPKKFESLADKLIEKDRERLDSDIGQNISDTFPLADYFIRGGSRLKGDISRFLRILFGDQSVTPTRLEYSMFEAKANALRSADLSRQVGAVITTNRFEIVSRGCNEVPVPGGDVYWHDDGDNVIDTRDISSGKDYNAVKKVEIVSELMDFLSKNNLATFGNKSNDDLVKDLVFGDHKGDFKHLRISNLIEFGRMVHAEMGALMEAARRGLPVEGGILICTTFPCHMCARHIISAGIREVYFIEPYPKSMTSEIYEDMIDIDPNLDDSKISKGNPKVLFNSFFGVAPKLFIQAFSMQKRKDQHGYALKFVENSAQPIISVLSRSHLGAELIVAQSARFLPKIADKERVFPDG